MSLKDKRKKLLEDLRVSNCYKGKAFLKIPMGNWINFLVEFEEQDKQAIKDLKDEIDNQIEAPNNWIGVGQAEILKEKINKIMGVWEE